MIHYFGLGLWYFVYTAQVRVILKNRLTSNVQPFVIEKIKNSKQYISCTLISIYTLLALDDKVDDMPKIEKLYLMCNKNIFLVWVLLLCFWINLLYLSRLSVCIALPIWRIKWITEINYAVSGYSRESTTFTKNECN